MPSKNGFARYFADLPDQRVNRTKKHRFDDILGVALCAVGSFGVRFSRVFRPDARLRVFHQ